MKIHIEISDEQHKGLKILKKKENRTIQFLAKRAIENFLKAKKIFTLVLLLLIIPSQSFAYTDQELCSAIYKSEGGENAQYLYGIRSVKYDTPEEARQICLNTIRNQRRRHEAHVCNLSYLECLAKRYCPIGADNDPKGLNKNWLKNVRYFLKEAQ